MGLNSLSIINKPIGQKKIENAFLTMNTSY